MLVLKVKKNFILVFCLSDIPSSINPPNPYSMQQPITYVKTPELPNCSPFRIMVARALFPQIRHWT